MRANQRFDKVQRTFSRQSHSIRISNIFPSRIAIPLYVLYFLSSFVVVVVVVVAIAVNFLSIHLAIQIQFFFWINDH